MLCKLSISNIKKSFKDYAIYFVTLILGVCIFYLFNSMDSQTAMLTVTARKGDMINILIKVLSYVSVFVSCILGFLIIYASRFLMKKRNKEFGVYMTLGMSKRRISLVLLVETFFIGLISLGIGLALGVALSQVTSIFIANMFEADMTKFTFNFSQAAMMKTILYFGIIYAVVMIFNTIVVNKNKLINLLQASKKQEKIKLKNPVLCIILFIISIAMLGVAYYVVTDGIDAIGKFDLNMLVGTLALGLIGTVLFFYSASGMLLKILSRCHKIYNKKLNTFVFKQISSKINTMVVSMSMICIMLFITLCMLSTAFTIKNYFNSSITKYSPVDFQLIAEYDQYHKDIDLKDFIESDSTVKNNTKDIVIAMNYHDKNLTFGTSLGKYEEDVREKYQTEDFNYQIDIMSVSDYNKLAKAYNLDTIQIKEDEYAVVTNFNINIYKEVINRNSVINIFGKDLKPISNTIDGFQWIGANPTNIGFFVVSDSVIDTNCKASQILIGNYTTNNKETIDLLENKISDYSTDFSLEKVTRIEVKEAAVGVSAIVTFIGLYLGIIFLISSSAILALKELSDCLDDKNKYKVLRQIGADEKEINKSLFKQTLIFFMCPLSLAIVHTIFGLKFCTIFLKALGMGSVLNGAAMTFLFLIAIYGVYFVITYLCGKNIIKERA